MKRGLKRCHYYDRRGDLRDPDRPCKKGYACHFIHPPHPDWAVAESCQPPPFWKLPDTPPSSPSRRSSSTHRSGSSTSRPRDSGYRPRAVSPESSVFRGRSSHRASDPLRYPSRDVSMNHSMFTDGPEPPRRRSSPRSERKSSPPSTFKRPPSSATAIERKNSDLSNTSTAARKSSDSSTTSTARQTVVESSFKVPPAPSKPASPAQLSEKVHFPFARKVILAVPPSSTAPFTPPPPPALPSLAVTGAAKVSEPKTDLSHEDKQKLWNQRVATLARYHKHKTEHRMLAERIRTIEIIFGSSKMRIPEKKRRDLEKLEKKFAEEKVLMDTAMSQLVDSDSWPVGEGSKSEAEELKLKKEAEEMHTLIDRARQLDTSLGKMFGMVIDKGKGKGKGKGKAGEGDVEMITDQEEGMFSRPVKRRRTLFTTDHRVEPDGPSMEELEELQRHLDRLDDVLSDLESQHYSQQSDAFDELVRLLDPSNQEYRNLLFPAALEMQANVDKMDGEIREVADETAKLLTASHDTELEITRLDQELVKVQQDFLAMTLQMQDFEKQRESDHREIEALEAALQMYKEHPPSPPASPFQLEHILPMIEEPVTQAVRTAVQEKGNALRSELEKRLEDSNELLYQTVWDKLVTTGRTVQVVMSRLQEPNQTGTHA